MKKFIVFITSLVCFISINAQSNSFYIPGVGTYRTTVVEQYNGLVFLEQEIITDNGVGSMTLKPINLTQRKFNEIRELTKQNMIDDAKKCWRVNKFDIVLEIKDLTKDLWDVYKVPASVAKGDYGELLTLLEVMDKYGSGETKFQECVAKSLAGYLF